MSQQIDSIRQMPISKRIFDRLLRILACVALAICLIPVLTLSSIFAEKAWAAQSNDWNWPTYVEYLRGDWPYYASSGSRHTGTDFGVPVGTEVRSTCDGTVVKTERLTTSYGYHIVVKGVVEGGDNYFWYAHLSDIVVNVGQTVSSGEVIGYSGSTGNSTGPHLHYEVRDSSNKYLSDLNPADFLPGTSYCFESHSSAFHNPIGYLDSCSASTGSVHVSGWCYDPDDTSQSIGVHIYLRDSSGNAHAIAAITADRERADVDDVYHSGRYHGFDATISTGYSGSYTVEAYGINIGEGDNAKLEQSGQGISIPGDTAKPVISDIQVSDPDPEGYTVTCKVSDNVRVSSVKFPSWKASLGTGTAKWYEGTVSNGIATCRINIADIGNAAGTYYTHVYAYDLAGNSVSAVAGPVKVDPDMLLNMDYADLGADFYSQIANTGRGTMLTSADLSASPSEVTCKGVPQLSGSSIARRTWHFVRGDDGWYTVYLKGDRLALDVNGAATENNATIWAYAPNGSDAQKWRILEAGDGSYYLVCKCAPKRVLDLANYSSESGATILNHTFNRSAAQRWTIVPATDGGEAPTVSDVRIEDVTPSGYTVSCVVSDPDGEVARVAFPTWTVLNGQDDLVWHEAELVGGRWTYRVNIMEHNSGEHEIYRTHIYACDKAGNVVVPFGGGELDTLIPDATITVGNKTYLRFDCLAHDTLSHSEAVEFVSGKWQNGRLATVASAEEQEALETLLSGSKRGLFWLGGTDEATEGAWLWPDGSAMSYANWRTGDPDNRDGEDYLGCHSSDGKWFDEYEAGAAAGMGIVMEVDAEPESSGYMLGDANGNGAVSIVDAQIVLDMANGAWTAAGAGVNGAYGLLLEALAAAGTDWDLTTLEKVADANADGAVDAVDARAIQAYVHTGRFA